MAFLAIDVKHTGANIAERVYCVFEQYDLPIAKAMLIFNNRFKDSPLIMQQIMEHVWKNWQRRAMAISLKCSG